MMIKDLLERRRAKIDALVLAALTLRHPSGASSHQLQRTTDLSYVRLFSALGRLEHQKLIIRLWEPGWGGARGSFWYRLTDAAFEKIATTKTS